MKAFPNWAEGCGCLLLLLLVGFVALVVNSVDVRRSKLRRQTQDSLKDITWGIRSYSIEYGTYPLQKEGQKEDLRLESSWDLLRVLMGENIGGFNLRQIVYLQPPLARDGKRGLIRDGEKAPVLVDVWGKPYVVIMDTNRDNRVRNPDRDTSDPEIRNGAPEELLMGVIAFSAGPDRTHGTRDDIVSWRK